MTGTEYHESSVPSSSIGRSFLSLRRHQIHAMNGHHDPSTRRNHELDSFQDRVAVLFSDLSSGGGGEEVFLSLAWFRKLLDAFLLCEEEFRYILFNNRSILSHPQLDKLISDFYDRAVKALDVCNAVRDGIEQVKQWQKHIEIVLIAMDPYKKRLVGEGQLLRAKKALSDLAVLILDEKDPASILAHRNSSFRSNNRTSGHAVDHFRSLSWSVSRSWSAARQLQAIGNNIYAPRGSEVVATNGLANPIFTMNSVLHFLMWALVAAIPCQDRGLQTQFSIPRSFPWGLSVLLLHDRIIEESRKKERRNSVGLLKEIHQLEKCTRQLLS
ncbi:hypothetical protein HPP92_018784 [Vanilla planifolia]|uniref:Uncharacterized protein n=1 Tax=Vanilla planifolia TaxID=51239 RepID=A0A835UL22_VANPL|nr:hypothetical protein HPP92_018784 [Vanilla planifolia]